MAVCERLKNSVTYEGKDDIMIVLSGTRYGDTNSGTMTINYVMEKGTRNIGTGNTKKSDDECSIIDQNYSDNGIGNSTGVVIEGHTGKNKAMRFEIIAEDQGTKKTQKTVGFVIMPGTTGNLRDKSGEEHREVAEISKEEDHVDSAAFREIETAVSIAASFMIVAEEEGEKGNERGIRYASTTEEKRQNRNATGVTTVCNVDDNVSSKSDEGKELAEVSKKQDRVVAAVNEEIKTAVDKASPAEVWNDIAPANPELKFETPVTFTSLAVSPDMNRTKASPNAEQERKFVRSPICCLMGHANAGKTKLFDCILGTNGSSNNVQGPVATAVRVLLTCGPMAGLVDEAKGRLENKSSVAVCETLENSIPFVRKDGAIILYSGPGYRDVSIMLPSTADEEKQNRKATGVMTVCSVNENVGQTRDEREEKAETSKQHDHVVAANKEIKTAVDKASPAEVQNDIAPANPKLQFKMPVTFTSLAVSPDVNWTRASPNAKQERKFVRSRICCLMGHADAGKTKLFDCIRGNSGSCNNVLEGCLTELIGVTSLPAHYIRHITERNLKMKFGSLVLVDFPGHEAFADVRALGSGFCDFAIVVVDVVHGLQPQTIESLNLLKLRNTRFIVALNKLDHIRGWKTCPNTPFFEAFEQQSEDARYELALKIVHVLLQLKEQGIDATVFYKNMNIAGEKVLLVPTIAASGEGIRELMQLLVKRINRTMPEEVPFIPRIATDVASVNCLLHELHKSVDFVLKGPVATAVRVLLSCRPAAATCEGRMENKGDSGSAFLIG